ncbi:hypothetical protein GCM10023340_40150 [Nocardioides marinquilinus]|uniref:Uncharacterized protein n=1 Tax=Nocardioides marinquilinus TaxID=1210400 RepID=A0ABP9Q4N7_9ACTN
MLGSPGGRVGQREAEARIGHDRLEVGAGELPALGERAVDVVTPDLLHRPLGVVGVVGVVGAEQHHGVLDA